MRSSDGSVSSAESLRSPSQSDRGAEDGLFRKKRSSSDEPCRSGVDAGQLGQRQTRHSCMLRPDRCHFAGRWLLITGRSIPRNAALVPGRRLADGLRDRFRSACAGPSALIASDYQHAAGLGCGYRSLKKACVCHSRDLPAATERSCRDDLHANAVRHLALIARPPSWDADHRVPLPRQQPQDP